VQPAAEPSPADPAAIAVTELPGVRAERAAQLARLGVQTVGDLLLHAPRRYENRAEPSKIGALEKGVNATVEGVIAARGVKTFRRGSVFELILEDATGRLHCRWWNQPWMERQFAKGERLVVSGRVSGVKPTSMDHPETEKIAEGDEGSIHAGRIVPFYPLTEGLTQRALRALVWKTLERFPLVFPEPNPPLALSANDDEGAPWPARNDAVRALHFPDTLPDASRARKRLALDELLALQLELQRRRARLEARWRAHPCAGDNRLMRPFLARLGFPLTGAQTRVLRELRAELGSERPMRRLLQGDVGSGKSLVAGCAALMTVESGRNVAVMAPTEILADQLQRSFQRWFSPLGVAVDAWTASRKTRSGDTPLLDAGTDAVGRIVVGTHALIEDGFTLDRAGLVIIDEQHKFGVAQRDALLRKGRDGDRTPHLLVMTATPIPRTLGLTFYGDLDASILDEMPPGRGRLRTHVRDASALPRVWSFVRTELDAGRQAYVVYPRLNDTGADDTKAAAREHAAVAAALAPHPVGLLHGQLQSAEKDRIMGEFAGGALKALVATSVIEVGLDVPNATVMVVENADRFGLAQLHQLRGRVGRGAHESHCILVADSENADTRERLALLESTTDGFKIAEADLRLRGPGDLAGRQQSGVPEFRFADLITDRQLAEQARQLAREWVRNHPE
jgi:ATP-dependent DNA helicase RecG